MGKEEKKCQIVRDFIRIDFKVSRGLFNSTKIEFKEKVRRQDRENLDRCLRENKMRTIWGNKSVLIR